MPTALQRRGFLAACTSALAAGCLGSPPDYDPRAASAWPMQRYDPGGTNHVPDATGPRTDPSVEWSVEVSGMGRQPTPVVHGDRLYQGSFDRFYAFDAATGEKHWELRENGTWFQPALAAAPAYGDVMPVAATDAGYEAIAPAGGVDVLGFQRNFEARWRRTTLDSTGGALPLTATQAAPPVVADGTLYATATDAVVAIDAATGRTEWTRRVADANTARVAVADGRVFVPTFGDGLHAYDATDGGELWTADTADPNVHPPTATGDAVFAHDRNALYAFDPETGDRLWHAPEFGGIDDSRTPVAVGDGRVVATGDYGENRETVAFDAATGEPLWHREAGTDQVPAVVAADTVYVPGHGVSALDAESGRVRWRHGDDHVRSLTVVEGRAYAVTALGTLYALEGSS